MTKIGSIAVFSVLVLLSGCTHYYCSVPGKVSYTGYTCWYEVTITKIDAPKGEVTGTLAYTGPAEYTFRVLNLDKLEQNKQLEVGKKYLFNDNNNSPYLQAFPGGSTYRKDDEESHINEVKRIGTHKNEVKEVR